MTKVQRGCVQQLEVFHAPVMLALKPDVEVKRSKRCSSLVGITAGRVRLSNACDRPEGGFRWVMRERSGLPMRRLRSASSD